MHVYIQQMSQLIIDRLGCPGNQAIKGYMVTITTQFVLH